MKVILKSRYIQKASLRKYSVDISLVKELRQMTLSPLGKCKQALEETAGDINKAKEWLRKNGIQTSNLKSSREAREGLVACRISKKFGALIELNCETDFVSRNEKFKDLLKTLISDQTILEASNPEDVTKDYNEKLRGKYQVDVDSLTQLVGEKVAFGRILPIVAAADGLVLSEYVHNEIDIGIGSSAAIVSVQEPASAKIGTDLAMQVVGMSPQWMSRQEVPMDVIEKEKAILMEEMKKKIEGKPADMVEKIIQGKLSKFYQEHCLLEQPWLLDNKQTVEKAIGGKQVLHSFVHIKIGGR